MPFEKWENGEELFVSIDRDVDLLDRDVRVWTEECDQMQGIQIFAGEDDAWGGFAARYVERLRDEYGKMAIWVWGLKGEHGKGQRARQLLQTSNTAKTMTEMSTHASMYIPLSIPATSLPPYITLDRNSEWHSSALLATALESITLPSRVRQDMQKRGRLGDFETLLNTNGNQRIGQLQCSIMDPGTGLSPSFNAPGRNDERAPPTPNPILKQEDGQQIGDTSLDMNFSVSEHRAIALSTYQHHTPDHVFSVVEVIRETGEVIDGSETDDNDVTDTKKSQRLVGFPVVERLIPGNEGFRSGEVWIDLRVPASDTFFRYWCPLEFPLLGSFPSIFPFWSEARSVAVRTSISTTSGICRRVKYLQQHAGRLSDLDERERLRNELGEIGEAYEEGWQSGSAEDSDD